MSSSDHLNNLKDFIFTVKNERDLGKLYVDKIYFDKIYENQILIIKEKSDKNHYTAIDIEDSILNTENPLKTIYNRRYTPFSPNPSYPYSQMNRLTPINKGHYLKWLDHSDSKDEYIERAKNDLVKEIEIFTQIHYLDESYEKAKQDNDIVFYSHGIPGWTDRSFDMNRIFKMDFSTNFGFGSASYFHTIITYNDIRIVPYSYLVKYRYAGFSEIHQYTRKYDPEYVCWLDALNFGIGAYNTSVENPNLFIEKYIFDEVDDMMAGLRFYHKHKDMKKLIVDLYNEKWEINDEEIYEVIGEKFSSALKFVESLRELKIYSTNKVFKDIDSYIKEILIMTKDVNDGLKLKRKLLESELVEELFPKLRERKLKFTKYHSEDYLPIKKELDLFVDTFSGEVGQDKTDQKIRIKFPFWESVKLKNKELSEGVKEVELKIDHSENYIRKYKQIVDFIDSYFHSIAA